MEQYFSKIKQRILEYAEFKGFSKRKIYVDTGIANGTLDKSSGLSEPNIEKFVSTYDEVNPAWLVTGKGSMLLTHDFLLETKEPVVKEQKVIYETSQAKTLLVTVNNRGKENIVLVSAKSERDYLSALQDPDRIKKFPTFSVPTLEKGFFRAFEVKDYSMLSGDVRGLFPSDIVIAEYVEEPKEIKDSHIYVVVSKTRGIVVRRCLNRIREEQVVICNSDNGYDDSSIVIHEDQIAEVWEFKASISKQMPMSGNILARLNNIETRLAFIEKKKLNPY